LCGCSSVVEHLLAKEFSIDLLMFAQGDSLPPQRSGDTFDVISCVLKRAQISASVDKEVDKGAAIKLLNSVETLILADAIRRRWLAVKKKVAAGVA
jgi:hypothetical protein